MARPYVPYGLENPHISIFLKAGTASATTGVAAQGRAVRHVRGAALPRSPPCLIRVVCACWACLMARPYVPYGLENPHISIFLKAGTASATTGVAAQGRAARHAREAALPRSPPCPGNAKRRADKGRRSFVRSKKRGRPNSAGRPLKVGSPRRARARLCRLVAGRHGDGDDVKWMYCSYVFLVFLAPSAIFRSLSRTVRVGYRPVSPLGRFVIVRVFFSLFHREKNGRSEYKYKRRGTRERQSAARGSPCVCQPRRADAGFLR